MTYEQNEQEMNMDKKAIFEVDEKVKQLWVIWFAGLLILIGLFYGANSLELLPEISGESQWDKVEWADWVLLGAGLWGLTINVFRAYSKEWPSPIFTDWFLSSALTVAGISQFSRYLSDDLSVNGELIGAVVIVGLGVLLLFNTLRNKDQE